MKRLTEYWKEQGLLDGLPCKAGDKLYQIGKGYYQIGTDITEYIVTAVILSKREVILTVKDTTTKLGFPVKISCIGKRFFLTCSEAEKIRKKKYHYDDGFIPVEKMRSKTTENLQAKTQGERIRTMSDGELADFLANFNINDIVNEWCWNSCPNSKGKNEDCDCMYGKKETVLEWLKSEKIMRKNIDR